METRNFSAINLMKICCILLTMCMYTGLFSSLNGLLDFVIIQLLAKIAFPFFFLYTSFFFFRKIDFSIPLTTNQNKRKLIDYLLHIIRLYVIWTIIYLPFIIFNLINEGSTAIHILNQIINILLVGSYQHLWIFPATFFAIILVYYMLLKFKPNELLLISLICYLIGMLINVYGHFFQEMEGIFYLIDGYLKIFSTLVNGLCYAFIFVVFGMKLAKLKKPLNKAKLALLVIIFSIIYIIEVSLLTWLGYANIHTQMYLSLLPLMYFSFLLLMQYQNHKDKTIIHYYATLVYLVQYYAIELCKQFTWIHDYYFICLLIILLISCLISFMILKGARKHKKLKVLYIC